MEDKNFDLLTHLGFSRQDIDAANVHICGAMTLEGAPFLKPEHYAVFDCANPCGRTGKRYLSVESHIRMMAAGAAVHLRGDLQDHQHAQRREHRGLRGGLSLVLAPRAPRPMRSIATAPSCRNRCPRN